MIERSGSEEKTSEIDCDRLSFLMFLLDVASVSCHLPDQMSVGSVQNLGYTSFGFLAW